MNEILISVVLPIALALIMFSLGLGLMLSDFSRVLIRPTAFLVGLFSQVLLVPAFAYVMITAFGISAELAVGFMILSFCPGGVTSNVISKLANGDVALSVSLTAVVSLLSMITVPLFVTWSVVHFMGNEAPRVSVTKLAISMALITALPVLAGLAIRHFKHDLADKIEPIFSKIAAVLFVIIVIVALASNWTLFVENLTTLGPSLIAFNVGLLVLGYLLAKILRRGERERRTISIETGIQNSTIGITLGTLILAVEGGFSAYSLPSAVYGITMYFVALPAVLWFSRRGIVQHG